MSQEKHPTVDTRASHSDPRPEFKTNLPEIPTMASFPEALSTFLLSDEIPATARKHRFFVETLSTPESDTPYPLPIANIIAEYAVSKNDELAILSHLVDITASMQTLFNALDVFELSSVQSVDCKTSMELPFLLRQKPSAEEPIGLTYILQQLTKGLRHITKHSYLDIPEHIEYVTPSYRKTTSYLDSLDKVLFASPAERQALAHPLSPDTKNDTIEMVRAYYFLKDCTHTVYTAISLNRVKMHALKKHLGSCKMAIEFKDYFNCFFEKADPLLQMSKMTLVEQSFDRVTLQNVYHDFVYKQYRSHAFLALSITLENYQSLLTKTFEDSNDFLYHFAIIDCVYRQRCRTLCTEKQMNEFFTFLWSQVTPAKNRVAFVWFMSGGCDNRDRAYQFLFQKLSFNDFLWSLSYSFNLGFELSNQMIGRYAANGINHYLEQTTVNHCATAALIKRHCDRNLDNIAFLWAITKLLDTILSNHPQALHHYEPVKQSLITAMSKINAATDPQYMPLTVAMYAALIQTSYAETPEIREIQEAFLRDFEVLFEREHPEEKTTARP